MLSRKHNLKLYCEHFFSFSLRYLGNTYLTNTDSDADLFVFLTGPNERGFGEAFRGTLCKSSKKLRISITQYKRGDFSTAHVRSFLNQNLPNKSIYLYICDSTYRLLPTKSGIT